MSIQIKSKKTIGCLIVFLIMLLSLALVKIEYSKENFDSTSWKMNDQRIRAAMVDDLLNKKILVGRSKTEILNLLGKPDNFNESEKNLYYLIDKPFFSFFSFSQIYFLDIQFNIKETEATVASVRSD